MGLKGWHWSCWTLIHWYGNHEVSWRKQKMKLLFSWLLLLFQVGDLEAFLMMIPSNGECMRTSLAVLEGLSSMPCFPMEICKQNLALERLLHCWHLMQHFLSDNPSISWLFPSFGISWKSYQGNLIWIFTLLKEPLFFFQLLHIDD